MCMGAGVSVGVRRWEVREGAGMEYARESWSKRGAVGGAVGVDVVAVTVSARVHRTRKRAFN